MRWTLERAKEAEAELQARVDADVDDQAAKVNLKAVQKIVRKIREGEGF
jgi:hypothetical protein